VPQTYLLITGAWHGGWAWRPVAERLRAHGHLVLTPTLPGLTDGADPTAYQLRDVVDFVVDLVHGQDLRDVVLVGHNWGGYVITAAAPRMLPRLSRMIYWSAFVPAADRPLLAELPPPFRDLFTGLAAASGTNSVAMPFEVFARGFIQDAPEPMQRAIHQLLVPQPMQYFTTPVTPLDAEGLGVPVSYLLSTEDVALPPGEFGWAPRFPQRLGVTAAETLGSHEALLTTPDTLAGAIAKL
jgi:pimeloyl-ACP methyl ester carboxylesterase